MNMVNQFTLSGRVYQVVPFLKFGERSLSGAEVIARSHELEIPLSLNDYMWVVDHLSEIPLLKVTPLVVVKEMPQMILVLYLDINVWKAKWVSSEGKFYGHCRLLRRLPDKPTK